MSQKETIRRQLHGDRVTQNLAGMDEEEQSAETFGWRKHFEPLIQKSISK